MFDLSPEKILLVGIIALLVLGPNRLPQAARTFGRFVAQMRRMSATFQAEVRDAVAEPTQALNAVVGDLRPNEIRRSIRDAVSTTLTPAPTSGAAAAGTPKSESGSFTSTPDDPSLN